MTVHDLWFKDERVNGKKTGERIPSASHSRGKRWRVDWEDPDTGKTKTQKFEKKTDAATFDNQVNADISRGKYVDPKAGTVTVKDYADSWRAQQIHDPSTQAGVERFFRLHVLPHIGGKTMAEVKRTTLQAWVKGRSDEMAASSLGTGWTYLKSMFADAVEDDVIGKSPCGSVTLPSVDAKARYIPTPAEVHKLATALKAVMARWAPVPYLAAGCGLRPSEILGLEQGHVNFLRREISVEQQVKWTKKDGVHIAKVKTALSKRTVDLPLGVADVLAAHLAAWPAKTVKLWDRRDLRKPVDRDVQLLFTTPTREVTKTYGRPTAKARDGAYVMGGRPIYGGLWADVWRDAVARAELPAGFGLHGLRHYFATLLIHKGKNVKTVQLALGHSTPMVTLNTYVHEWPNCEDRTRDIVDAELFAPDVMDGDAVSK